MEQIQADRRSTAVRLAAVLGLLGALVIAWIASVWRWGDCHTGSADCDPGSAFQMWIAIAAILPFAVALVQASRSRGRPWRWLSLGVATCLLWGLVAFVALYDFG